VHESAIRMSNEKKCRMQKNESLHGRLGVCYRRLGWFSSLYDAHLKVEQEELQS
jgi:hypothetical protein